MDSPWPGWCFSPTALGRRGVGLGASGHRARGARGSQKPSSRGQEAAAEPGRVKKRYCAKKPPIYLTPLGYQWEIS